MLYRKSEIVISSNSLYLHSALIESNLAPYQQVMMESYYNAMKNGEFQALSQAGNRETCTVLTPVLYMT